MDTLGADDLYKSFCAVSLDLTPESLISGSHGKIYDMEVPDRGNGISRRPKMYPMYLETAKETQCV